jgi:hypothetical protein
MQIAALICVKRIDDVEQNGADRLNSQNHIPRHHHRSCEWTARGGRHFTVSEPVSIDVLLEKRYGQ